MQSLIGRGQRDGAFRSDLPRQWLITTAFSLMHAAAEDAAAGRVTADDAARLITATLVAAYTPPAEERNAMNDATPACKNPETTRITRVLSDLRLRGKVTGPALSTGDEFAGVHLSGEFPLGDERWAQSV